MIVPAPEGGCWPWKRTKHWPLFRRMPTGRSTFREMKYCMNNTFPVVREAMQRYLMDKTVEGLLFKYLHFYGSYSYIGDSRQWYRREIRVIRNTGNAVSS